MTVSPDRGTPDSAGALPGPSDRARPNILVTGTPGTGKTTTASLIAEEAGFTHIDVSALVKKESLHCGRDDAMDSLIIDEDKVVDALEDALAVGGVVLDYHSCDFFPERWFDLVVVLTTDNASLYDRLAARGYSPSKITANVECEIMRVCVDEAAGAYDEAIVKVLPSNTVEEMEENVAWAAGWAVGRMAATAVRSGGGVPPPPPPGPTATSAAGLLALLSEPDPALSAAALRGLNACVPSFWFEIATSVALVEAKADDPGFEHRELAALVASKVFYHLGELDDALTYALAAGSLFNVDGGDDYTQAVLAKCIDAYISHRTGPASSTPTDTRLTALVELLFDGCCGAGRYEAAVGVALEARRLDKLQQAVVSAGPAGGPAVAAYALRAARTLVPDRAFREQVMRLLVGLAEDGAAGAGGVSAAAAAGTDWPAVAQCLAALGDAPALASLLDRLLRAAVAGRPGGEEAGLLALQIGFDIAANEDAPFAGRVLAALERGAPKQPAALVAPAAPAPVSAEGEDAPPPPPPPPPPAPPLSGPDAAYRARLDTLARSLDGSSTSSLSLAFLHARCASDPGVLAAARAAVEPRNSLCHGAVVFANAVMHAGTTVDAFLRSNLDWLARATNWAKFSATAGLGSIHRGHTDKARALMAPYLPRAGGGGAASQYSEGGALFAVGLVHAGLGTATRTRSAAGAEPDAPTDAAFLLDALRSATAEPVQHGAALGVGCALLGSADPAAYEALKDLLYGDAAVAGEGAGLGIGLLCAGAGPNHAAELVAYARDTQHEKIIRGCAVGAALTALGAEQGADGLIEDLCADADPVLRYGGMFAAGLAYAGTGHPAAVARLLHAAVSDVSDDVRRGAVISLGFTLCNQPEAVPRLVALLAESFNPHVRYGAALALGVACAATGARAAMDVLDPLLGDAVDFVRQGAALAAALVNQQQPAAVTAPLRASLAKAGADKHEEVMGRVGAIMAAGILDAGGRNAALAPLRSPGSGALRVPAVAGLALFCQYWHWHPLAYFLPLALTPATCIGVEAGSLRPPAGVGLVCECRPSLFAHPPPVRAGRDGAETAGPRLPTAVLSTTARAAALAKKKAAEDKAASEAAMETDDKKKEAAAEGKKGVEGGGDKKEGEGADGGAPAPPAEPASYKLDNPARIAPGQARFVRFDKASRWVPAVGSGVPGRKERVTGVVVLKDRAPAGTPIEWALPGDGGAPAEAAAAGEEEEEPAPPPAIDME